jgi:hypothetical protein
VPVVGLDGQQQQQQQQQQQWPAVAMPQLPNDLMPRALMVEYLPVEFTEAGEDRRVFAKNLTQFYFRCAVRCSQWLCCRRCVSQAYFMRVCT